MARIGMMSSPSELYGGGGGGKKGKKEEKKSGLTIYAGGKEKTPTGLSNAFNMNDMGLTPDVLMQYAQDYNLPTTSNREFQAAQLQMLQSTPEGQAQLQRMYDKYGMPKAGRYDDDILGVRTQALISDPSVRRFRGEIIPIERNVPDINLKLNIPETPELTADDVARSARFFGKNWISQLSGTGPGNGTNEGRYYQQVKLKDGRDLIMSNWEFQQLMKKGKYGQLTPGQIQMHNYNHTKAGLKQDDGTYGKLTDTPY